METRTAISVSRSEARRRPLGNCARSAVKEGQASVRGMERTDPLYFGCGKVFVFLPYELESLREIHQDLFVFGGGNRLSALLRRENGSRPERQDYPAAHATRR